MSFEGRYQKLCPNNHYEEQNVYMETSKCRICGEKWVKSNLVDDTNEVGKGFDFAMASVHITENDKLKLFVEDAKKEGIRQCINLLRTLQHTPNHRSQWNHSADVNFAPVELSDYLLKLLRDE